MRHKTYLSQRLSRSSYFGLLILVAASQFWPAPPQTSGQWVWLLLSVAPLLAFVQGLRRQEPRSLMLLALISLLYFCHAVVTLMGKSGNQDAAFVELVLSLALFFSGTLYARWRSEELKMEGAK
ncbi:MAG: DUF2069 domain-containing protein [Gammaproteobacteria bacterium]|nr:DUF2069 domain-containing protein [Gammaproteobacteria bacterium]